MKSTSSSKNFTRPILAAVLCALVLGATVAPLAVYADGESESGETGGEGSEEPGTPGGEGDENPGEGSGDYNENPDRTDPSQGGSSTTEPSGNTTNSGSGNNSNNGGNSGGNSSNTRPSTNNSSNGSTNGRGSSSGQAESKDDSNDKQDSSDDSDSDSEHQDTEQEGRGDDAEVTKAKLGSDDETQRSQEMNGLVWIFAGVIAGIVVLVGIVALVVDRFTKKHDIMEDVLGPVLDAGDQAEILKELEADGPSSKAEPKAQVSRAKKTSSRSGAAKKTSASAKSSAKSTGATKTAAKATKTSKTPKATKE